MDGLISRKDALEAQRKGLTREQARKSWEEAKKAVTHESPPKRRAATVMQDGIAMDVIDSGQLESLKEIARLSLLLLEYTERGGAPSALPYQFITLVENLRSLETLLKAEPGTGQVVGDLLRLLDSLES